MILTNKFNVEYDMEAIDRDFDVFQVEKPKDLYKTNILDLATEQFKAKSVQYTFGKMALVLFDKNDVSEQKFKEAIMTDYPDVKVCKIDFREIGKQDESERPFYYQHRLLLQLLVNSICVPRVDGFSYNNLAGKLLYSFPSLWKRDRKTKKVYSTCFLEISFDPGMYLNLNVKTFRKSNYNRNGRFYITDPKTGCFRRKLKEDNVDPSEFFTEAAFTKKNTINYLNLSSFDNFKKCKLGIMEQFLQDVQEYLGKYVTLTAVSREGDQCIKESKKEKDSLTDQMLGKILNKRGINIVDVCRTEESEAMIHRIVAELQAFYGIVAKPGGPDKEMYNIRLIHNADYYEKKELPDPYKEDLHGFIVQHLTIEDNEALTGDVGKKESPVLHKVLVELILKGDVHDGQISIYNWEKLSSNKAWTFVRREKMRPQDGKFDETINAAGKKTWERYSYTAVEIVLDGKMKFCSFDDTDFPANDFEERIRFVYDTYADKQRRAQKEVEGLVFNDINNMQVIIRTREKTMPNTAAIWNGLRKTNEKDAVLKEVVEDALISFADIFSELKDFADQKLEALQTMPQTFTKGDLKKLINVQTKGGKQFNRFLHEEYDIWVSAEIRSSKFNDVFMLDNLTNIKWYEDFNTDGEDIHSLNYYAGKNTSNGGLKFSVHNACIVRQVQAEQEVEFEELLPLMAVDFIRVGDYTVLPFPFKYLREYQNML